MSEQSSAMQQDSRSAGHLLREARLSAGVDAAALAAQLKVPLSKVEAMEADQHGDLPGLAFTRGLAQAMARALKIDSQAVLSRLPQVTDQAVVEVGRGLNAPFKAHPGMLAGVDLSMLRNPIVWGPLAFLAAGVALWLMPLAPIGRGPADSPQAVPSATLAQPSPAPATASPSLNLPSGTGAVAGSGAPDWSVQASSGATNLPASVSAAGTAVEILHSAPMLAAGGSDLAADGLRPLQLRAGAASWVEVRDAKGSLLLSRTLQPGETISLAGALPLKAVVGNAADTTAIVHGRDFNIAQFTSNNVARFEVR